ncbi:YkvA family protein [Nitrosomonas aestuarii]|uniref:YkvA family protein n=1 Tax=Nitrosomonas aestuarii TaxID=52441 RepID=UPI000D2F6988|nr:YkvA family protein [Nitrosomonas aestuarii]PTN08620.1 uncharacterized protein DUF1232 [Nitrosomonas aestuarii]
MSLFTKIKQYAQHLKSEIYALYLASRDPRTPWYTKLIVASIVAYALSPIDLIPDFVPILGYLDDLILLPLGIALAIKLIPDSVLIDCRIRASESIKMEKPVNYVAGAIIITIWLIFGAFCIMWIDQDFMSYIPT